MKLAVINYGMGNLGSVRRSLEELGANVLIADRPDMLADADRIILPGVGAFEDAMSRLREGGWVEGLHRSVVERRKPLLGVCLGMQMLATVSEENGLFEGLDYIPGRVVRLVNLGCDLRIPHVGWNEVSHGVDSALFRDIPQGLDFYFVHSFAVVANDQKDVAATTSYGAPVVAAVQRGHVFGTQFHPEKSSKVGRQLLKNFLEWEPC